MAQTAQSKEESNTYHERRDGRRQENERTKHRKFFTLNTVCTCLLRDVPVTHASRHSRPLLYVPEVPDHVYMMQRLDNSVEMQSNVRVRDIFRQPHLLSSRSHPFSTQQSHLREWAMPTKVVSKDGGIEGEK